MKSYTEDWLFFLSCIYTLKQTFFLYFCNFQDFLTIKQKKTVSFDGKRKVWEQASFTINLKLQSFTEMIE